MHIAYLKLSGKIKTIRKTTTGLHYAIFDAQMFVNSSVLSLLQNIFRTRLASMSIPG